MYFWERKALFLRNILSFIKSDSLEIRLRKIIYKMKKKKIVNRYDKWFISVSNVSTIYQHEKNMENVFCIF